MSVFHLRRINLPIWDQVQNGLTCRYDILFSIVCFIRLMISWTFRYSKTNPYATLVLFKFFLQKRNWSVSEIMKRKSPKAARLYLHVEAGRSCDSPLIGRMSTGTCLTEGVPRCYLVGAGVLCRVAVRRGVAWHNPLSPLATGVPPVISSLVSPDSRTCHRQLCMT